jgi:NAD+ synthase
MKITPTRLMSRNEPWPPRSWRRGSNRETVLRVGRMLNLAEYKRRQTAPGVKVTLRNFGRDPRYPIVNRFRDAGTPLPQPDASVLAAPAALKTEAFDL